jgi:hypothetical protein
MTAAACSCSYEDVGTGESGPSLSVVADEACPLHGREAEPAEWAEFDAWVAGAEPMSPAEAAYYVELEAEEAARRAAGGLELCPRCKRRTLRTTARPTRNYGGGWDTYEACEAEGCGYAEVST